MSGVEELVKGLLEKGEEDIRSAEILYRNSLEQPAIFHLQQASEKILKAYFIGYWIKYPRIMLEDLKEVSSSGVFKIIVEEVEEIIEKYSVPKHLKHDFKDFLKRFLPKYHEEFCGGGFSQKIELYKEEMILLLKNKQEKILGKLQHKGLSREQSLEVLDLLIELALFHIYLDKVAGARLCRYDRIGNFYENIKRFRTGRQPCLEEAVEFYKFVKGFIDEEYFKLIEENKEVLEKVAEKLYRSAVRLGLKLLEKHGEKTAQSIYNYIVRSIHEYIIGNVIPYMSLPLHYCLLRYYNVSRYPEGEIPEEEFAAVPRVIVVLKELHRIVGDLVL